MDNNYIKIYEPIKETLKNKKSSQIQNNYIYDVKEVLFNPDNSSPPNTFLLKLMMRIEKLDRFVTVIDT